MEALSALSLASNIVQFLDFGLRVLSKGNKIYRSVDGALEENLDLEVVTSDLLVMQTKLKCTLLTSGHTHLASDDLQAFNTLSESCAGLADKLLERLNMVKAQGRFRRWKSLRQALKIVWSKQDIENTKNTLQSYRSEMQLHLLISLRSQFDFESLERSHSTTKLDKTASRVLQALKDNADVFDTSLTRQTELFNKRFEESDFLLQKTSSEIMSGIQTMSQKTDELDDDESQPLECAVLGILASLSFPGMNDRYERVVDAHANTYSWIFESGYTTDQPWDSFTSWLGQEKGASIYWVSGKAASGKSTLMRYIMENQWKLCKSLHTWTKSRQLMTLKFFFWSTGTVMQKSQNGLFRSLLHQIFIQDQNLVQDFFPDLVQSLLSLPRHQLSELRYHGSWRHWSLNELKHMLSILVKQHRTPINYFFLIDGLDEYDGDYLELSAFLKGLSTSSNVKLCLSSRPLLAFELHFDGYPNLRLQDLTVGDISRFVRDKLEEHPRFYVLAQKAPQESSHLINEIVQTSCGVFLWVSLVVKSLSEGLTNHDGLPDLQKRLRELPPELEGLYSTMLGSINPPFYREQASRLFQLVYQSPRPLSPAELSYADDEDQDLAFKTKMDLSTISEIEHRAKAMVPRLTSRCAGLLEIQSQKPKSQKTNFSPFDEVRYLHLTVREYLEKPDVWSNLVKLTSSSRFNASVSLLRAKLLTFKIVRFLGSSVTDLDVGDVADLALQAEDSTGKGQTALLEAIHGNSPLITQERIIYGGESRFNPQLYGAKTSHTPDEPPLRRLCHSCPDSLLTFAVANGLTLSVKDFIHRSHGLQKSYEGRSLLDYATWCHSEDRFVPKIQPSMVAMLFEEGLGPNDYSCGSTPWQAFLKFLAKREHLEYNWASLTPWVDVCRLFVLFGANVKFGCMLSGEWKSTWEVLESAFQHLPCESLQELKTMVLNRGGGKDSTRIR